MSEGKNDTHNSHQNNDDDDVKFVNMTDDDVDALDRRLGNLPKKEFAEAESLINKYYQTFLGLIAVSRSYTKAETDLAELDRLQRLLKLLPKSEIFVRSYVKIWQVRNHVINKNIDYFLKKDYSHVIKKDSKQVMIETIISIVREKFPKLEQKDQDQFWLKGYLLINIIAQIKKILGDEQ